MTDEYVMSLKNQELSWGLSKKQLDFCHARYGSQVQIASKLWFLQQGVKLVAKGVWMLKLYVGYSGWIFIKLTHWVLLNRNYILCYVEARENCMCVHFLHCSPRYLFIGAVTQKAGLGGLSVAKHLLMLCCCCTVTLCYISDRAARDTWGSCLWKSSSLRLLFWWVCFTLKGAHRRIFMEFSTFTLHISSLSKIYLLNMMLFLWRVANLRF